MTRLSSMNEPEKNTRQKLRIPEWSGFPNGHTGRICMGRQLKLGSPTQIRQVTLALVNLLNSDALLIMRSRSILKLNIMSTSELSTVF